jgi:alpha-tubulin suppressor-like RCC1 family protein
MTPLFDFGRRASSGLLALVFFMAFFMTLLMTTACQPEASDCTVDSDCSPDQVCAAGGGLLVRGGVCVLRAGARISDAGDDSDGGDSESDGEPDVDPNCVPLTCAQLGATCGSFADGCGGVTQCGEFGCIAAIDAGSEHTCAVRRDGDVYCWGANDGGQLGSGKFEPWTKPHPVCMGTSESCEGPTIDFNATVVSAGSNHSCALDASGMVWCWGSNDDPASTDCFGQLGTGDDCSVLPRTNRPAFGIDRSQVEPVVVSLQTRSNLNCARNDAGQVYCWGSGAHGQIGDGQNLAVNPTPAPVQGLGGPAVAVALSECYACALRADALVCWGDYDEGCAGDGLPNQAEAVFDQFAFDAAACITKNGCIAGGRDHTCFIDALGKVYCFNDNEFGQLGIAPSSARSAQPVEVAGLPGFANQLVAGDAFTCALQSDGAVYCWGANESGQLGDGSLESSHVPVQVNLSGTARLIAAGASHACAVLDSGGVQCWGSNVAGQLGNGQSGVNLSSATPVDVAF